MSRKILIVVLLVLNTFNALSAPTEMELKPFYEPVKDIVFIKLGTYRMYQKYSVIKVKLTKSLKS